MLTDLYLSNSNINHTSTTSCEDFSRYISKAKNIWYKCSPIKSMILTFGLQQDKSTDSNPSNNNTNQIQTSINKFIVNCFELYFLDSKHKQEKEWIHLTEFPLLLTRHTTFVTSWLLSCTLIPLLKKEATCTLKRRANWFLLEETTFQTRAIILSSKSNPHFLKGFKY